MSTTLVNEVIVWATCSLNVLVASSYLYLGLHSYISFILSMNGLFLGLPKVMTW